jgi:hypothetical protein
MGNDLNRMTADDQGGRRVLSAAMGFRWTAVDGKRLVGFISARRT